MMFTQAGVNLRGKLVCWCWIMPSAYRTYNDVRVAQLWHFRSGDFAYITRTFIAWPHQIGIHNLVGQDIAYMPPWVTRFIYAVPVALGIPDFVPAQAGVWHYAPSRYYHSEITVARAPRRIGQTKVPDDVVALWLGHLHTRYWYQRLYRDTRMPPPQTQ